MIPATNLKVFIETYGCQMNMYDSELIRAILLKANYSFVEREDDADIVMLNTCAIRENAHQKVYGRIHNIHHKFNPAGGGAGGHSPMIGILGCMATNLRKELFENRKLKVDFIAGPDSYKRLPDLIRQAQGEGDKPFDLTLSEFETYSDVYPARTQGVNAWLAVMRGCNNFCTFCVVPYTRGRERSREPENVVSEVRRLAAEGFKQVTLLGQNVNSYYFERADFAELLEKVSEVKGIERIRFMSPHPKDFPERLLKVIVNNPKVCKHVHLPLQAGNSRILDLMNRTYTREEYLDLVAKIRGLYPDMILSTDIIVGFPTETNAEFEDTVRLIEEVQYDFGFIFKYSARQGTIASKQYADDISDEIKTKRIMKLDALQRKITLKKNQADIGKVFDVLLEGNTSPGASDEPRGRTDGNKIVILNSGPYKQGDFVKVKITDATVTILKGEVVAESLCTIP